MLGSGAIDRVRQQLRLVTILGDERLIELTIHRAGASVDGTACAVAILEQIGDRGVRGSLSGSRTPTRLPDAGTVGGSRQSSTGICR